MWNLSSVHANKPYRVPSHLHIADDQHVSDSIWSGSPFSASAGSSAMRRDHLVDWVVAQGTRGVAADQFQGVLDRPVGGVVETELQHRQQLDQPSAVMVGVGALQSCFHRSLIRRPRRLELRDQIAQHCLGRDREHRVAGPRAKATPRQQTSTGFPRASCTWRHDP